MKIVTFTAPENSAAEHSPRVGALLNDETEILDFDAAIKDAGESSPASLLAWFDTESVWFQRARAVYQSTAANLEGIERARQAGLLLKRSNARLLAPVPRPGKLICIGLNYRDHAAESKMPIPERPLVFSKFTTSVIAPNDAVVIPRASRQVDYEAELAVVVGRRAKNVKRDSAFDYVLGYTIINDVSARDFQFADGQWQRGKSCDTFAPMGEFIATTDEIPDPHKLPIKLRLNGQTMQDSNTDQFVFGVPELIEFLSETITLEPGDVIATGTPPGVGFARKPPVFLQPGDVMEIEIENLGTLRNTVVAASENIGVLGHSKS